MLLGTGVEILLSQLGFFGGGFGWFVLPIIIKTGREVFCLMVNMDLYIYNQVQLV